MKLVTREEMRAWRKRVNIKSESMGALMGINKSAYGDVETGRTPVNLRHHMLFERATLTIALERKNPNLVWHTLQDDLMTMANLTINRVLPHMPELPLPKPAIMVATDCGAIECVNRCDGGHGADYAKCPHHRLTTQR